jgi:hypothetical protein
VAVAARQVILPQGWSDIINAIQLHEVFDGVRFYACQHKLPPGGGGGCPSAGGSSNMQQTCDSHRFSCARDPYRSTNVKTYQDFNGGRWLKHEASQVHLRMMVLAKIALKESRDVLHVQVLACPDLWFVNQQSRLRKSSAYEAAALVGCGTFRPCANPIRSR